MSAAQKRRQSGCGRQRRYPTGSFLESELFAPGPAILAACRYSPPIVRVCIPHQTRTYAIANSVSATPQSLVPQGFKNSVPKPRRQEVSRKTACKSEKTGKTGDFGLSEVRS